jgi:hypothetical protein
MICCGIVYAAARVANIRSNLKCVETRRNGSDTRRNGESHTNFSPNQSVKDTGTFRYVDPRIGCELYPIRWYFAESE